MFGVKMYDSDSPAFSGYTKSIREELLAGMTDDELTPVERQKMGNALAAVGDPRFRPDRWYLPDETELGFVCIPEGTFPMGADGNEVFVPTFYIAKYQTTGAQYRAFTDDTEFEPGNPDCLKSLGNHPVPWVNWFEAMEYTRWLQQKLVSLAGEILSGSGGDATPQTQAMFTGLRDGTLQVCLPSEAEWEKAALGDTRMTFPWGEQLDTSLANFKESKLDSTVAVGTFPKAASPYGVLDMSGNAWDWQRTIWGPSLEEPIYSAPYVSSDGREDLNAPSDLLRGMRGGGFPVEEARAKPGHLDAVNPADRDDADSFRVVLTSQV